jgi:hypothetical protein
MTEEQNKHYDEASKRYLKTLPGIGYRSLHDFAQQTRASFISGCLHAHEVSRKQTLDEVESILRNGRGTDIEYKAWFFKELQKLRL